LVFEHLGDAQSGAGNDAAARSSWQESVRLLEQVSHDHATVVRAKLG
jgi:hypothetical protein